MPTKRTDIYPPNAFYGLFLEAINNDMIIDFLSVKYAEEILKIGLKNVYQKIFMHNYRYYLHLYNLEIDKEHNNFKYRKIKLSEYIELKIPFSKWD